MIAPDLSPERSTAVKRLGQFFVLFRESSFTANKWKHEQGHITRIYIKLLSVNVFSFLSHKQVSLLLNAPHRDKLAFKNGANKFEFVHFQILRTFFLVKFQIS